MRQLPPFASLFFVKFANLFDSFVGQVAAPYKQLNNSSQTLKEVSGIISKMKFLNFPKL